MRTITFRGVRHGNDSSFFRDFNEKFEFKTWSSRFYSRKMLVIRCLLESNLDSITKLIMYSILSTHVRNP